ncbi:hypothetical protein ACJ41O_008935 [Fusarium nematophilum]
MIPIPRDPASFFPDKSDGTASFVRHSLERTDSGRSRQGGSASVSQQQSVRFAGPSARPRRNLASRASEGRDSPTKTSSRSRVGNANARPSSTLSFHGEGPQGYSHTRRYLESLQPPDACYSPEDDAVSMPASFRRLRKSRSMLTSSNRPTTASSVNTTVKGRLPPTDSLFRANTENEPLKDSTAGLRASTSMSFLRNRRGTAASRSDSRAENDLAVQLARERFREQVEQQGRLTSRPSMIFRSKNRRSEGSTGLRKSLRNSSNNSTVLSSTFSTNSISAPKQPGLRRTARKVSNSLRSKLKGLFTRGKSTAAPEKQGDGQDTEANESDGESCLNFGNDEVNEEASMCRVTSHIPSLHDVPSNQQLRSRQGSVESLESGDQHATDDKSRVTSWTNSVTNTVSSAGMLGEWERQRLSVIKENGTHISSSSQRSDGQKENGTEQQDGPAGVPIDSQRVYEALMKRLGERSPDNDSRNVPGILSPGLVPDRSSSHQAEARHWASSTIRCVRPDDDVFRDDRDQVSLSSSTSSEQLPADPKQSSVATLSRENAACLAQNDDGASQSRGRCGSTLSASELPRTMTHRSSAFFASPICHSFRSPSPYRRALRESANPSPQREQATLPGTRYLHSLSALSLPTRRNSSADSDKDFRVGDAESVYSCATEDARQNPIDGAGSVVAGQLERPTDDRNDAVMVPVQPYCPIHKHQRDTSTASSVEWKTWLSSKVSKLEAPLTPTKADGGRYDACILPMVGHVREGAEIGSPLEVLAPKIDGPANRSPLSSVKGNALLVSDTNSLEQTSRKTLGYDENEAPNASARAVLKGRPPSIPPRSTLRTVPSLPIVGTRESKDTGMVGEVHRMRSLNTIGRLNSTPEEAIVKRRSRTRFTGWQGSPTKSSPGVGAMTDAQGLKSVFASPAPRSGYDSGHSTPRTHLGWERMGKLGATGKTGPEIDAQVMGSKTMVDMFLNSRRKRTDGSGGGMGSSPAAFL